MSLMTESLPTASLITLLRHLCLLPLMLGLTACVTLLDATHKAPIEPDPGKRSIGAYVDDQRLETILRVNLRKLDPAFASANARVTVFNGVVLLTGQVPSAELRQAAGEHARTLNQVRQVHNELAVQSNATFFSRRNDQWIATKVRSKILTQRDLESDRIKSVVENRVVYLMGLLTREEADQISQLAASTVGVDKVVRVIEYIQR